MQQETCNGHATGVRRRVHLKLQIFILLEFHHLSLSKLSLTYFHMLVVTHHFIIIRIVECLPNTFLEPVILVELFFDFLWVVLQGGGFEKKCCT